jgi:hypothetical protein
MSGGAAGTMSRGGRKGFRNQWTLDQLGLYQYSGDRFGFLRKNEKDTTKAWWHNVMQHPASPLRRPPLRWYFLTEDDVGAITWDIDNSGGGTPLAIYDKHGGWALSVNGSGNDSYYSYFSKGEVALPQGGRNIWVITEIMLGDVDQIDLFFGLCAKLGSGDLFDNRVDSIGFTMDVTDTSSNLRVEARKDGSAETEYDVELISDETPVELAFVVSGTRRVDFFVNNYWKAAIETGLPDDEELALAFGVRNGQAVANELYISTTQVLLD